MSDTPMVMLVAMQIGEAEGIRRIAVKNCSQKGYLDQVKLTDVRIEPLAQKI